MRCFGKITVHLTGHGGPATDGGKAGHAFFAGDDLTALAGKDLACRIGIDDHLTSDGNDTYR